MSTPDDHPSPADEKFEHIPWEHLAGRGDNRRLVAYGLAGAILIAGLTAAIVRGNGSFEPPVPTPVTDEETLATSLDSTITTVTAATTTTQTRVWSEADLMAVPPEALAAEAAALAEWITSDYFTIDGSNQIAEGLAQILPPGSELPGMSEGARSFVEWARAISIEETTPGTFRVLVVVRRLGAANGQAYRRVDPIGVVVPLAWSDEGWSILDLPSMAAPPDWSQAPSWEHSDVPADVAAAATSAGGELIDGTQVGNEWRLVVAFTDDTGGRWPLVIWSDAEGNRIPGPHRANQP